MGPSLKILVQPYEKLRFRYGSESGSHGCLKGQDTSTKKSFPTVKLENYHGNFPVYITATLYTNQKHPVKHVLDLVGPKCENGICIIKTDRNLIAEFNNVSIRSKKRKEVEAILESNNKKFAFQDLKKDVNFRNSVKICFEAFQDKHLQKSLCKKIFSKPIYDAKSSSVGNLKLCRISQYSGSCKGSEEMILLCDKIKKDNIDILFVEKDSNGEVIWQANGMFNVVDIHHQVAIPFKTPPYHKQNIEENVHVTIELCRKSDGERSNSLSFVYKPDEYDEIFRKTQKHNLMKEDQQIENMNILHNFNKTTELNNCSNNSDTIRDNEVLSSNNSKSDNVEMNSLNITNIFNNYEAFSSPMDEQNDLFNSSLYSTLPQNHYNEFDQFSEIYPKNPLLPLYHDNNPMMSEALDFNKHVLNQDFIPSPLNFDLDFEDSNNVDVVPDGIDGIEEMQNELSRLSLSNKENKKINENSTKNLYARSDGDYKLIVQKTFQELINFISQLISQNIYTVLNSLISLLWIHNNEGNTFLHLALLYGGNTCFIGNLIIISNVAFINKPNKYKQTALHLAILKKDENLIHLLLKHGANPCNQDIKGDNGFHLCVKKNFSAILKILLSTSKFSPAELNVANYEGFSPIHLAVLCNSLECLQLILDANCNINIQETRAGQTALHLALKFRPHLVDILLKQPEIEKRIKDFSGRTPIEIAFISKNPQLIMQFSEDKTNKVNHSQNPLNKVSNLCLDHVTNKEIEKNALNDLKEKLSSLMDPPSENWRKLGIYLMDEDMLDGLKYFESNRPTSKLLDELLKEDNGLNRLIEILENISLDDAAKIVKEYAKLV